tara:strand:- start:544 stop:729 length:186 start_codon:yes stop_codon:yes gene_type:complete
MNRHFLVQDIYNNWYCLPESERDTWNRLERKDDLFNYDAWDAIEKYKVDVSALTFENPMFK